MVGWCFLDVCVSEGLGPIHVFLESMERVHIYECVFEQCKVHVHVRMCVCVCVNLLF